MGIEGSKAGKVSRSVSGRIGLHESCLNPKRTVFFLLFVWAFAQSLAHEASNRSWKMTVPTPPGRDHPPSRKSRGITFVLYQPHTAVVPRR